MRSGSRPLVWGVILLLSASAFAQAPGFEAVAIRPSEQRGPVIQTGFKIEPNRLTVEYYNVVSLLEEAYQLQDYQLRLSAAAKKDKTVSHLFDDQMFDIQAVTAAPVSPSEMRARLGRMLARRFRVVSHWETERVPMERLEVLPGGIELKQTPTGFPNPNSPFGGGPGTCGLEFKGPMSMPQLANRMTVFMTQGRPVVDHTGLDGFYVIELKFLRPGCVPTASSVGVGSPQEALKAAGLQMTPARDPIRVLVVDSIGPVAQN